MNKLLIVVGIIATSSAGLQAGERPVEMEEAPVRASFQDGPTGFRYVWQRDTGWRFAGTSPTNGSPGYADQAPDDAPLARFAEERTGSKFEWRREGGWTYVGGPASPVQKQKL